MNFTNTKYRNYLWRNHLEIGSYGDDNQLNDFLTSYDKEVINGADFWKFQEHKWIN